MAERRPVREREPAARAPRRSLTAAEAGRHGLRQIAELTGKDPEGVSGVEPSDDNWLVTVDVVEDHRIPSSTDVLASYEAELGPDGDLIAYRRVRRYTRGSGDRGGDVT
jgi:Gas vesicle synthesis protein GvpO